MSVNKKKYDKINFVYRDEKSIHSPYMYFRGLKTALERNSLLYYSYDVHSRTPLDMQALLKYPILCITGKPILDVVKAVNNRQFIAQINPESLHTRQGDLEDRYYDAVRENSNYFDIHFTGAEIDLDSYWGKPCYWLPAWAHTEILDDISAPVYNQLGFIGHRGNRRDFFSQDKTKIILAKNTVPKNDSLENVVELCKLINKFKILVNPISGIVTGMTGKTFEYMACKRMCLCYLNESWMFKTKLFFEDNKDIVFFKTLEEMEDKYKYYINNEEELNRIARAGYENVRRFHNADLRAKRLAEIVLHHANGAKFNPRFNDIELFTDKKKTRLFPVPSQTNNNEFEQLIPFMDEYEIKSILCCFDLFANPVKALEWGSGNSSIYFSSKLPPGSTWDSIEHNLQWANKVTNLLNELAIKNVHLHYVPNNCEFVTGDDGTYESFRDYILFPTKLGKKFQLIVVDGRARVECMQIGWMLLEDAGVMILHDAQRTMYYRGIPPDCFYLRIVNTRIDCEGNISTLFMSKSANIISKIEDSIQKILPEYINTFSGLAGTSFTEARKKMVMRPNHPGTNLLLKNAQGGPLEGGELLAQGIAELRSGEPGRKAEELANHQLGDNQFSSGFVSDAGWKLTPKGLIKKGFQQTNDPEVEAIQLCQKAVDKLRQNEPSEALKILDEAQHKSQAEKLAIAGLQTIRAACLLKSGRLDEAVSAAETELSLQPDSKDAQKIYKLIKTMQKKIEKSELEKLNNCTNRPCSQAITWEQVKQMPLIKLYAGDLPQREGYDGLTGLSLTKNDQNHLRHDIMQAFPLADSSIDSFQAEDVLEHIPYEKLAPAINEIYRVLKPCGLFRLSVPDYGCDILQNRSIKNEKGQIAFDPGGGGTPENPGHVWFPRIDTVMQLLTKTKFHESGKIGLLHYYNKDGTFVTKPIDYSKGHVRRTPDFDERVKNPYRPMSLVIDLIKEQAIASQSCRTKPEIWSRSVPANKTNSSPIWCSEKQNQYTQSRLTGNSPALSANQQVSHSTPSCSAVGLFDAEPSEQGRIYILPVQQQFQPTSMPARYPKHNDFYGVEQDFLLFLQNHKELITHNWQEARWHYLPVFWTHWLVSHDYGKRDLDKLQEEANRCILDDSRTFTICQYADGPLVDVGLTTVFLSSRNTERGIDIPCLCAPHKKPSRLPVKKYLASFVGRLSTGEVRRQMAENLKGHSDILITDRSEGTDYFAQTMLESYISLSPRGYGGGSFRFYEAMQLGTVPFLIGDIDTRAFKDFINWDEVSFYAPDASDIAARLSRMNKQQLLEMGAKAAKVWAEELSYQNWCRYVIKELQSHSDPITGFKVDTGMNHFLSFIIPCYNCADTVGEAIESIYQQNLDIPFEVVCTDDSSEDSTRKVLSYYQKKLPNFHIYYHNQNKGGAAARNTCVVNSKGDLIFCLDSDNVLVPDLVGKLIKLLDETGCDGATVAELRYFEGTNGSYRHTNSWFYEAPNNICDISHILSTTRTPAASGNYLYTRKSFDRAGGYPEGNSLDTLGFGFRQHATGGEIAILPGTFYWHRLSSNSYWVREQRKGSHDKNAANIVREFPELFTDETNRFLASPDCEKDFLKHLQSGRFKAVPKQSLAYLFQGYREQLDQKYSEAVNSFSRAISFGCKHWKVVWRLSRAAYNAGNMNLAEKAAVAVTKLAPNFIEARELLQQIGCKPEQQTKSKFDRIASNPAKPIDDDINALKDVQIYHDAFVFDEIGFDNSNPQTNGEYAILSRLIRPGDIVFDVGANKGKWSKHVLSTVSSVQIHSFEPIPDTFTILKNTLNHPSVFLHNIAISDRDGEKTFFYYNKNSDMAQMSSFYRRPDVEKKFGMEPLPILVQAQTLDSFCKINSISHIDFLKIDTEGGELDVLRGAVNLLLENRIKKLQFEYGGTYPDAGITLRQVCELLSSYGYVIFRILSDGFVHIGQWRDSLENNRYSNYLAVSPEQINDYEPMNGFSVLKTEPDCNTKVETIHETDTLSQLKASELWNEGKPLRLHLGCGQQYFDGYINIDHPPSEHTVQSSYVADIFGDIKKLEFPQQSVDEIRMHHVFEHFSRVVSLAMLIKWHKWLKIGGKICIETPDIEASIKQLSGQEYSHKQKQSVLRHIFGSHEASWAVHKDGWYREKFQHVLSALGFEGVDFEHSHWQTTHNITVTAKKQQHTNVERLREVAKDLLRNDIIDESESEEKLWSIWCEKFDRFFNEANLGTTPKVSIFMPVYNGQKYLAETIESIISQTYRNFEFIIADDGSTDRTLEVARGYQQRDNRIKVISLPHKGEVHARNEALKHVNPNSLYLLNHDSDDISSPTKLERLVEYLENHPEIAIAGCFAEYFDDEGNCKGQPAIEYEPGRIRQTFGNVNSMIHSASLIRRKVFAKIGGYREEYRRAEDYDFFARALLAGFNMANIPEILHKIRLHPKSIGNAHAGSVKIATDRVQKYYKSHQQKKLASDKPQLIKGGLKLNNTLSILHTVELYNPHVGGAEWVVQQLSERLAKRGHNVTVATTKLSERIFDQLNGVQIEEFNVQGTIAQECAGSDVERYQQFLLKHPADIMMNYAAQQWATDLAFETLASTSNRRVNIIAPCGYSALSDSKSLQYPQFADYFNKVIPTFLPKYDAAVYHSGLYQDYEFAQNHGFKNSIIIPNGVCEKEFSQIPKLSFRQKFNVTTKYMGLCVANFYKDKGQDRVIECVKQMNRTDFTMVFIGKEGGELCKLQQLASGSNVRFCAGINREDTLAAYHEADIFLFGSKKECSPLVIVEAKASRTPFVSTDCGNVREWKGGVVCAPEKMAVYANRILDEEVIRKSFAEDGWKEWKEKLTWESVINRYEQLYSRLYFKKFRLGHVSIFNPIQSKQLQHT